MVKAGGDFWRSSGETSLLKHTHRASGLGPGPDGLIYPRWKLHSLPGQPESLLRHSDSEKVFSDVQRQLLCFSLCPLPSLSLDTTKTSLALPSLHLFFSYVQSPLQPITGLSPGRPRLSCTEESRTGPAVKSSTQNSDLAIAATLFFSRHRGDKTEIEQTNKTGKKSSRIYMLLCKSSL